MYPILVSLALGQCPGGVCAPPARPALAVVQRPLLALAAPVRLFRPNYRPVLQRPMPVLRLIHRFRR